MIICGVGGGGGGGGGSKYLYIPAALQHGPLPWDGDLIESSGTASNCL